MFKRKVIESARHLLWKLVGKDFLILSPDLTVSDTTGESIFISKRMNADSFLPVKYNYHTDPEWKITYKIQGNAQGMLSWSLATLSEGIFCRADIPVTLPFTIEVCLREKTLYLNGEMLSLVAGKSLPLRTPLLLGDFLMTTDEGLKLRRRTAHRIQFGDVDAVDADYYQGQVYGDYEQDAKSVPEEIFKSLSNYISAPSRFLEIGCATGLTVEYAAKKGFHAEGVDVSEWAVEQANKRNGGSCRVLDFDKAKPADFEGQYGLIVMHSVIEHLKDPEKAIKLLFELCCPGGLVYIQTLNADSLMHAIMKKDWGGYSDHTHESPWISSEWLSEVTRQAGFESVSVRHYHLWNDNVYDDVWDALNKTFRLSPLNILLEDGYGDAVELIVRRPHTSALDR